jgi:nicotinate-nucleotide adenylyltransferase
VRVGLLGGAFNPPHEGHLELARLALAHLGLDEVRFVPTALSPHKADPGGPDGATRLRLLADAIAPLGPGVRVEPLEVARGGASYTVDTLETLAAREPGQLWILLMGSDQLPALHDWRRIDRIVQLAAVAVALRPGQAFVAPAVAGLRETGTWSGAPGELVRLPSTERPYASSDLRATLHDLPEAVPEGLPPQVLRTIRSENLYR